MLLNINKVIDLIELERRLDEALSKETPESLRSWLFNERKNLDFFLGEGTYFLLKGNPCSFKSDNPQNTEYQSCDNSPSNNYAKAA